MRADSSILTVGSIAAFGIALSYLASGLSAIMMPSELQRWPDITPHQFWLVLSQDPIAHLAFHWSWVAAGFFGLAAVPAISMIVWESNRGAILWSGAAALYGFAVLTRSHLMEVAFDRRIIPHYQDADPAFQQAVHVVAGLALDVPDGFLTYGAIGVWVVTVSSLGLRYQLLPKGFCSLGFASGATYFAGVLGYTLLIRWLILVSVGIGGLLLIPAWYVWAGFVLRGRAAQPGAAPDAEQPS